MKHTWTVRRQITTQDHAQRHWDQGYCLLVQWATATTVSPQPEVEDCALLCTRGSRPVGRPKRKPSTNN